MSRLSRMGLCAALALSWIPFTACSSSSGESLTCGAGTLQQGGQCVATPTDAGDATVMGVVVDAAADGNKIIVLPPNFMGISAVAPVSDTALLVTWNPGSQPNDPTAPLAYHVYQAQGAAAIDYGTPAVFTGPGATSAVIGGLTPNTSYTFGTRAVNGSGVEDANTVTIKGTPVNDTNPPTFDGAKMGAAGGSGAVTISWDAARDDLSPAQAISYLVYESDTAGGEDFTAPTFVTAPGATSATVARLPNATKARFFVVRARDAAGNVSTTTKEISAAPGADTVAPVFGGCTAATMIQAITIATTWTPATDDVSAPENITYDIYASQKSGQYDFTQPFAKVKGGSLAQIGSLKPGTRYFFVCRAHDEAGNEDHNVAEVTATTGNDPTPPTFAGITPGPAGYASDPASFTATLTWGAATDNSTPPEHIIYDIYASATPGGEDFSAPPLASSAPGETMIVLTNLTSNRNYYFVVRARDADGNHDANLVERPSATEPPFKTNVRFSADIQPIFSKDCGVVGCHVPGNPTGNLVLVQGLAYGNIVGMPNGEGVAYADAGVTPYIVPQSPLPSYLYAKIDPTDTVLTKRGSFMPAPSTGSTLSNAQKATFFDWITQGALNN